MVTLISGKNSKIKYLNENINKLLFQLDTETISQLEWRLKRLENFLGNPDKENVGQYS